MKKILESPVFVIVVVVLAMTVCYWRGQVVQRRQDLKEMRLAADAGLWTVDSTPSVMLRGYEIKEGSVSTRLACYAVEYAPTSDGGDGAFHALNSADERVAKAAWVQRK